MEYKYLGRTGLKVSELCMGSMSFGWTAPRENCGPVLEAFVAAGGNFIDTADVYSRWAPGNPGGVAEELIGAWLKTQRRDQVIIATKVRGQMGPGPNDQGLSRQHIIAACEASLRRLQTDYIDLYQTHSWDEHTPLDETLRALDDLVQVGKVRYLGCSNLPAWHLMGALWTSEKHNLVRYDCLQPHYNLVHRGEFEREHRAVCLKYGLGVIPYSPIAGGLLSGKYRRGVKVQEGTRGWNLRHALIEKNFLIIDKLDEIAQARSKTVLQVALAWIMQQPGVTSPIIGVNTVEQWQEMEGALGWRLNEEEIARLNEASKWEE
ncbi:MAG TPA: aldo/keto reductase [Anaerolineae bacterium]|nr:aldo/keto reductase [Anaerolineae bacterium]